MGFLKNFFSKKEPDKDEGQSLASYHLFWKWFRGHEGKFFSVVRDHQDSEYVSEHFFDQLAPRLDAIKEGYRYLTGMYDDNTVELVLTADGNAANIAYVEELVAAAPQIDGWKFTALKQAMNIERLCVDMYGYSISRDNLSFYQNDTPGYPDEVDIVMVQDTVTPDNQQQIALAVSIFLDNYLGELVFVSDIDRITTIGRKDATKELIPVDKLKDYLLWRKKEFAEKYDGTRYNSSEDEHSIMEAVSEQGNAIIAVINTDLLKWDAKASHPWIAILTIHYEDNNNGMPSHADYESLNFIEDEILPELRDVDGYLNIGRQTCDGKREIYFACCDFRLPSKVFFNTQCKHHDRYKIDYEIYKDKYWQSFEKFEE